MEEYASEKRSKKEGKWNGRTDLYVSLGGRAWIIEAKRVWVPLVKHEKAHSDMSAKEVVLVGEGLEKACADAVVNSAHAGERIGALFALPAIPAGSGMDTNDVRKWLKACDELTFSASAAYFPERGWAAEEDGYLYPGLTLFLERGARLVGSSA